MLTAYIDFKSPGSYLAIDPVVALAERNGLAIEWRPFRTRDREIPKVTPSPERSAQHAQMRLAMRNRTNQFYASLQGKQLRFPSQFIETELALGAMTMIEGDRLPFVRSAFDAYWNAHTDLDSPKIASLLLKDDADEVELRAAFATAQAEAEAIGVVDAPAFVIDGQIFIGREHLPWIEEIAASA